MCLKVLSVILGVLFAIATAYPIEDSQENVTDIVDVVPVVYQNDEVVISTNGATVHDNNNQRKTRSLITVVPQVASYPAFPALAAYQTVPLAVVSQYAIPAIATVPAVATVPYVAASPAYAGSYGYNGFGGLGGVGFGKSVYREKFHFRTRGLGFKASGGYFGSAVGGFGGGIF